MEHKGYYVHLKTGGLTPNSCLVSSQNVFSNQVDLQGCNIPVVFPDLIKIFTHVGRFV